MRGLLIIEPLYHQVVAGNKTQTRRSVGLEHINEATDEWEETGWAMSHTEFGIVLESVNFCQFASTQQNITFKPRYKVGEVLYLKEPISFEGVYKYNTLPEHRDFLVWKNKLFMPASAARAFIRITGIKCERLMDISDDDCIAEGIEWDIYKGHPSARDYCNENGGYFIWRQYKIEKTIKNAPLVESFISLYKFANKMKPTTQIPNIWVFVYEFEYLKDYKP